MPQIIIQYSTPETLQVLKSFARYFDYSISTPKPKNNKRKSKKKIDETALLSEKSLAEAWDSPEDERWDKLYAK